MVEDTFETWWKNRSAFLLKDKTFRQPYMIAKEAWEASRQVSESKKKKEESTEEVN